MSEALSELARLSRGVESVARHYSVMDAAGGRRLREVLDALPAAVYTTDAAGRITYYNEAAVALWGCRPVLDSDRWCGSWGPAPPPPSSLPPRPRPLAR